jgi:hypothetical protein
MPGRTEEKYDTSIIIADSGHTSGPGKWEYDFDWQVRKD